MAKPVLPCWRKGFAPRPQQQWMPSSASTHNSHISNHQMPPCVDITPETVAAALRSFPAGTSPGPTGLRAQHLLDASSPGDTDCFIHALTCCWRVVMPLQAWQLV